MSTLGARAAVVHERQRENIADLMGDLINGLLAEPTTTDVILNPPLPGEAHGRLWVTRLGRDREPVGTMSPEQAMRLIGAVAASMGNEATVDAPSVEGILITDGCRFTGCIPPIVAAPFFAIRRPASSIIPLARYVADGKMTEQQKTVIEDAVARRLNVLIVGGTGSGKTTLLNAAILTMTVTSGANLYQSQRFEIAMIRRAPAARSYQGCRRAQGQSRPCPSGGRERRGQP